MHLVSMCWHIVGMPQLGRFLVRPGVLYIYIYMGGSDLRMSQKYRKTELSPGGPKFPRLAWRRGRYYEHVLGLARLGWVCFVLVPGYG